MATPPQIVAAIDAYVAASKRIAGSDHAASWGPGFSRHEVVTKYPLEIQGELRGNLMIVGFPYQRELKFRLEILFPAPICRLDYTDETHSNSLDAYTAGLPAFVQGPHYHSWPLNRRFFKGATKPPKLHDAAQYTGAGRTFDAVLRWFCADTGIESLRPDHRIGLPPTELLV